MSRALDRLAHPSRRDLLVVVLPIAIAVVAIFWLSYHFVRPSPPDHVVIAAGRSEGSYHAFAERYREFFTRTHITLEVRTTAGAEENLRHLLTPGDDVDVGFVQGGIVNGRDTSHIVSLGTMYPEPLWVFRRKGDKPFDSIDALRGLRIAVGPEGSGTRVLAMQVLEAHGIAGAPTVLSPLSGLAAASALSDNAVDAVFAVGAAQSGTVWTLLYTPGLEPCDFVQAEAYVRRFPYLKALVLPRGAIDFARNIPEHDLHLVAPMATLVAREDLHPAIVSLLMQAASEVHGSPGLFQKLNEFPSPSGDEIEMSAEAERYFKSGKPFLQRYLPFWAANLVARLLFLLVPVIAVLVPLVRIAPAIYAWRVRSRVFRYYGELKLLELHARTSLHERSREEWLADIDRIEAAANRIRIPLAFSDQLYTLRQHLRLVRDQIVQRFDAGPAKAHHGEPVAGETH